MGALVLAASVAATFAVNVGGDDAGAAPTPGCVVDLSGVLGWWRGEDALDAEIGPAAVGTVGFDGARVGRGFDLSSGLGLAVPGLGSPASGLTIETWLRSDPTGLDDVVFARWVGPEDYSRTAYRLSISPRGGPILKLNDPSTAFPQVVAADGIDLHDGELHHIAATWTPETITLYVDGAVVATEDSAVGSLAPALGVDATIGQEVGPGPLFSFDGILDELTVWDRSLDAAEVSAIHDAGASGKCSFVPEEAAKFVASAPAANEFFGYDVAVGAATVAIGTPMDSDANLFAGTVHTFDRSGSFWFPSQILTASDAGLNDQFGWSVDLDDSTLVASAYFDDVAPNTSTGSVYVFARSNGVWTETQKLANSDLATGDGMGFDLALDGDVLVVGTPFADTAAGEVGAAYVYRFDGSTWLEEAKLLASDGAAFDLFGTGVAVDSDTIVVGAPSNGGVGAAYVFTWDGAAWSEQAKLVAADADTNDLAGFGVGVAGDRVAVGSPNDDDVEANSGSVNVYLRTGASWTLEVKLAASAPVAGGEFGSDLALNAARLVVGATRDSTVAPTAGAGYVFDRTGTTWTETAKVLADDGEAMDLFGNAVDLDGAVAIFGAYGNDDAGNNSGSAYVFES